MTKPADHIWAPHVIETHKVKDFLVLIVEADQEFDRANPEFIGWRVSVDGEFWTIFGHECNMPAIPIYPGEKIGLAIRPTARGVENIL